MQVHAAESWPEELGEEAANSGTAGVLKMILLEHKDCLLTAHSDRCLRVWSTKKCEFLQRLGLVRQIDRGSSGDTGETALIGALQADTTSDRWLFTGDTEGWVRVWDVSGFNPSNGTLQRHLLMLHECQPHRLPVTHLQHFELDGVAVIMSASVDCSIVLSTVTGTRVGTFTSKRGVAPDLPLWSLADKSLWCTTAPPLEDPRMPDEKDSFHYGRRQNVGQKYHGHSHAPGHSHSRSGVSTFSGSGLHGTGASKWTPRRGATQPTAQCGQGIFKKLSVVERFKPDLLFTDEELQKLERHKKKLLASRDQL